MDRSRLQVMVPFCPTQVWTDTPFDDKRDMKYMDSLVVEVSHFAWISHFPAKNRKYEDASLKNKSLEIVLGQAWRAGNKRNYFCTSTSARNEREQWLHVLLFLTCKTPSGGKILLFFCMILGKHMVPRSPSPHGIQANPSLGDSVCGRARHIFMGSLITSNFSSILR